MSIRPSFVGTSSLSKLALAATAAAVLAGSSVIGTGVANADTHGYGYDEQPAVPNPTPIYRHFNGKITKHFFTASAAESGAIRNGVFKLEGTAMHGYNQLGNGNAPVYRAFNPRTGAHLMTTSLAEYTNAKKHGYTRHEGVAFYGYANAADVPAGVQAAPVYRFINKKRGGYILIQNTGERKAVQKNKHYQEEGVVFYAPVQ